jgi:hypothetical protein
MKPMTITKTTLNFLKKRSAVFNRIPGPKLPQANSMNFSYPKTSTLKLTTISKQKLTKRTKPLTPSENSTNFARSK